MKYLPEPITDPARALALLDSPEEHLGAILEASRRITRTEFGGRVDLCSIVNAVSGNCSENCSFCTQSSSSVSHPPEYPFIGFPAILEARRSAAKNGARHFSVVASGRSTGKRELQMICEGIRDSVDAGPGWCASLGIQSLDSLKMLRNSGLQRYHHNLESSESHYSSICSTHPWHERMETLKSAKEAGLKVCSGGILGIGESRAQRVELAFSLLEADVDSIALNFLIPLPGIAIHAHFVPVPPAELIRAVAMFRFVCPTAEIRLCGGRSQLKGMMSKAFEAGVTGIMTGPLLTTGGSGIESDRALIASSGMEIVT